MVLRQFPGDSPQSQAHRAALVGERVDAGRGKGAPAFLENGSCAVCWGHMKKGRAHFIVSSGLQVWGPPVRTAGDAEILLVNVEFREEGI